MTHDHNDSPQTMGPPCDDVRQLLSAALDGEVSESEEARLAKHLARCGACARFRADLVELEQALQPADLGSLPNFEWERVGQFISGAHTGASSRAGSSPAGAALWGSGRTRSIRSRPGSLIGHPIALAAASILVITGAFLAVRSLGPAGWFEDSREEAVTPKAHGPVLELPMEERPASSEGALLPADTESAGPSVEERGEADPSGAPETPGDRSEQDADDEPSDRQPLPSPDSEQSRASWQAPAQAVTDLYSVLRSGPRLRLR